MSGKTILLGTCIGVSCAALAAAVPAAFDWYSNPGGIFRTEAGTDFTILFDTWFSWFWPVTILAVPGGLLLSMKLSKRSAANHTSQDTAI